MVVVTSSVDPEWTGSRHEITGLTKVVRQGENDEELQHICAGTERKTTLLLGLVGQNIASLNFWELLMSVFGSSLFNHHGQVMARFWSFQKPIPVNPKTQFTYSSTKFHQTHTQ